MTETIAATVFTVFTGIVIIFQGLLAAGVPWGKASMGGKYPGKYPPKMRMVAVLNMIILGLTIAIVLSEAALFFPGLKAIADIGIWVVAAFFFLATIMNTITPSKIERIWAPVAAIQFASALIIGI